jgi:hypothetical protein
LQRTLEELPATEPVVVVAEAVDAILSGESGLRFAHLWDAQVVEAEISRQMGLVMSAIEGLGAYDVSPLGKSLAPKLVVLRYGMKLWEIERD